MTKEQQKQSRNYEISLPECLKSKENGGCKFVESPYFYVRAYSFPGRHEYRFEILKEDESGKIIKVKIFDSDAENIAFRLKAEEKLFEKMREDPKIASKSDEELRKIIDKKFEDEQFEALKKLEDRIFESRDCQSEQIKEAYREKIIKVSDEELHERVRAQRAREKEIVAKTGEGTNFVVDNLEFAAALIEKLNVARERRGEIIKTVRKEIPKVIARVVIPFQPKKEEEGGRAQMEL